MLPSSHGVHRFSPPPCSCVSVAVAEATPKGSAPAAKAKAAAKAVKKGGVAPKKVSRKVRTSVHFNRPKTLVTARNPAYIRSTAEGRNKLDQHRVLRHPLTSESAMKLIEDNNTLTFICDVKANKRQIKAAVENMYEVGVARVNTLIRYATVLHALARARVCVWLLACLSCGHRPDSLCTPGPWPVLFSDMFAYRGVYIVFTQSPLDTSFVGGSVACFCFPVSV